MNKLYEKFEAIKSKNPDFTADEIWNLINEKEKGICSLYVCNECCETFRSMVDECSFCCSHDVECLTKIEELKEPDKFKIIAAGIEDKADAEEIARRKKGEVVQGEDKKFSVTIKEGLGDDFFTTQLKYNVYDKEEDDFYYGKVSIQWKEEINYSSWGINDISVRILKPLMINDGKKDITIPIENITIEWEEGHYYQPVDIEIEGNKATITFSYISKNYNP